jgi:hypothetical protein
MKRVKTVLSACADVIATTFGSTRPSHGIFHSVASENILCISTQRWTTFSLGGPYLSVSLFDMAIRDNDVQPAERALVPSFQTREAARSSWAFCSAPRSTTIVEI